MFTRRNAVNSFLRNIYYMFCIQSRILSDVGVHYIVEDYILSSGPLLQHSSLMEKETNQQVESCLGHLTCNGPSNPSFNRPLFSPACVYSTGQCLGLQSRFPGLLSDVFP
ncbi:rCG63256 [Rattus norvegicus]|uniref:RCG63256 n=1 Tax=Rattus norvegicus TaxID=10116 RepID=A6JH81_RAT|nr:rCG63256 [Rattus norvegicus]